MKFEFDLAKSKANAVKHAIDFQSAQKLWTDEQRLVVELVGLTEPRWLLVARLGGKLWTAVFTRRGENIRIISVRRSREGEKENYEDQEKDDNGSGV